MTAVGTAVALIINKLIQSVVLNSSHAVFTMEE